MLRKCFDDRSGADSVIHSFSGPDGAVPWAGVIAVKGAFYGTRTEGGSSNDGTVFALSASGSETILHNFTGNPDGAIPTAPLIDVKGILYGTTEQRLSRAYSTLTVSRTAPRRTVASTWSGPFFG